MDGKMSTSAGYNTVNIGNMENLSQFIPQFRLNSQGRVVTYKYYDPMFKLYISTE